MIRLDNTTRKLQILLAGAVTTSQLPVNVSYSTKTASTYNGSTQISTTNSGTAVDICGVPGASEIRDIDLINIYNADTASAVITIRYNDNGALSILIKVTLLPGETLTYTHARGWLSLDSNGTIKESYSSLTALSPTTASVTGASAQVVAGNLLRKSLIIINVGSDKVSFGVNTSAVVNSGITLTPNGTWVMDESTFSTAAIYGISPTTTTLSIQEYD